MGDLSRAGLTAEALPVLDQWRAWMQDHPPQEGRHALTFQHDGLTLHDWLDGLRASSVSDQHDQEGARPWRFDLALSRLAGSTKDALRADRLLGAWVWSLLASACDRPINTLILGRDRVVVTRAMDADHARAELAKLLDAWQRALLAPLPVACQTALAWLDKPEEAYRKYNPGDHGRAEGDDVYLKRLYPDFGALMADGQMPALAEQLYGAFRQWMGSHVSAVPLVSDEDGPVDDAGAAGRAA